MTEALNNPINHGARLSPTWVENFVVQHVPCFGGSERDRAAGDALKCPLPSAASLLVTRGAPETHMAKGGWGWKCFGCGTVRKKLIFNLKQVLVKAIPCSLCPARGVQHLSPFICCLSRALQIVLWGNFLPRVIGTFFPYLDKWCGQQRLFLYTNGCFLPDGFLRIQPEKTHEHF